MTIQEKIRDAILGISKTEIEKTAHCTVPVRLEDGKTLTDKKWRNMSAWAGCMKFFLCALKKKILPANTCPTLLLTPTPSNSALPLKSFLSASVHSSFASSKTPSGPSHPIVWYFS